ncbi:MAG: polyprenyl synthetase family protein [Lacipirellulaceae bacterium]
MTTQTATPPDIAAQLQRLFAPIAGDLNATESRLRDELSHQKPFIDELAQHSFRMSGKRLRPALLLLTAAASGKVTGEHTTLAAVVEMVHTATLVHDDVLDEADVRRHTDTVNARWSNQTSVLLGDYLFTHAFYLASTLETPHGCRTIGHATNRVCEGELLQTASAGNFDISREEYLHIIDAKTAALCACACELGAFYAGANEKTVTQYRDYGSDLGIAFQIADDLLDLIGDESDVGKSLGTDLAHCKMTLPLINLRDQCSPADRTELERLCTTPTPENLATIQAWLSDSGEIAAARRIAVEYAERAADRIRSLKPESSDNGSARRFQAHQSLMALAEFVIARNA